MAEAHVLSGILLKWARAATGYLFRNNRGAFKDKTGRWVRYGLANESKKFGDQLKSSDLIGWRRIVITPEMVGASIAQFVSIEAKAEGWTYNPNDDHEVAQKAWIDLVNAEGGCAAFLSSPDQLP